MQKQRQRLRFARAFALLTGLSVTSFVGSHMVRGTQALLTAEYSTSTDVKTIHHFKESTDALAAQGAAAAQQAQDLQHQSAVLADKVASAQSSQEANGYVQQMNDLQDQASAAKQKAEQIQSTLEDWKQEDATPVETQTVDQAGTAPLHAAMVADSPVMESPTWETQAVDQARDCVKSASDAVDAIASQVAQAEAKVQHLKDSEAQAAQTSTASNKTTSNQTQPAADPPKPPADDTNAPTGGSTQSDTQSQTSASGSDSSSQSGASGTGGSQTGTTDSPANASATTGGATSYPESTQAPLQSNTSAATNQTGGSAANTTGAGNQ